MTRKSARTPDFAQGGTIPSKGHPNRSRSVWAIPTNEELMIAMDTAAIVKG